MKALVYIIGWNDHYDRWKKHNPQTMRSRNLKVPCVAHPLSYLQVC